MNLTYPIWILRGNIKFYQGANLLGKCKLETNGNCKGKKEQQSGIDQREEQIFQSLAPRAWPGSNG